jgi:hypothetical protein
VYPGSAWNELVSVAQSGVQVIAIINPDSGPNYSGPDSSYKTYIQTLVSAGVVVIGYVHTSWGARNISTVTGEVQIYKNLYAGVTGIFFDEASTDASEISYYQQAYDYVLSVNFDQVILNPGSEPAQGYLAVSTSIVVYENYASDLSTTTFDSWVTCAPSASEKAGYKYRFSMIMHTATLAEMPSLVSTAAGMGAGLVYVTDGVGGCCTYNTLCSFFSEEGSSVLALNS